MHLIVGLGNPGSKYQGNRHNIGFMAVDEIVRRHGFSPWRKRFQGETSDGLLGGEKVLLLKPQTYMNESGRAVGEAMRFFDIDPSQVIVLGDSVVWGEYVRPDGTWPAFLHRTNAAGYSFRPSSCASNTVAANSPGRKQS